MTCMIPMAWQCIGLIVLLQMKPLFGDQDFLEDQHILIAVIAKDADNESYGRLVFSEVQTLFYDDYSTSSDNLSKLSH